MNPYYYQECQYYLFKKQQNAQIYSINSKIEFNSFAYYQKVKIFIKQLCQNTKYSWSKIEWNHCCIMQIRFFECFRWAKHRSLKPNIIYQRECHQSRIHQQHPFNPSLDSTQLLVATSHMITSKRIKIKEKYY